MASRAFLITLMVATAVAPALATDYTVGDDSHWKLGFDYAAWAKGIDFRVGDNLIFKYTIGKHNVVKVNGADFQRCTSSNATEVPLNTGNDVIPLTAPGKRWYICDIDDHCPKGMKLLITVSAADLGPSPALIPGSDGPPPGPDTSASGQLVSPLGSCVWLVALFAAYGYKMIMV